MPNISLSALAYRALGEKISLKEVWERLRTGDDLPMAEVLDVIFQSLPTNEDGEGEVEGGERLRQRLHNELLALLSEGDILEVLHHAAPVLWQEPDNSWAPWLRAKFKATMGAALLDAVQQICPDLDAGDLILDLDPGPRPPGGSKLPEMIDEIWLTENTLGGNGIIEELLVRYGEDPRRFFDIMESSLEPSDLELMDEQLHCFLKWAVEDKGVQQLLNELRTANRHDQLAQAFDRMRRELSQRGLVVCHPVITAINTRILRPGSSADTDLLLYRLMDNWRSEEERLGIEVDARVFAYLSSAENDLDQALGQMAALSHGQDRRQWRFNTLYSLLWPRGSLVRAQKLSAYNPFTRLPEAERDLVRDCLTGETVVVSLEDGDWQERLREVLVRDGVAVLRCRENDPCALKSALLHLLMVPMDAGLLLIFPRIRGVCRGGGDISVNLELAEAMQ